MICPFFILFWPQLGERHADRIILDEKKKKTYHFLNSTPSVCQPLCSLFPCLYDFLCASFGKHLAHIRFLESKRPIKYSPLGLLANGISSHRNWDYLFSPQLISAEETRLSTAAPQDPAVLYPCPVLERWHRCIANREYFGLSVSFSFVLWLITWDGRTKANMPQHLSPLLHCIKFKSDRNPLI